MGYMQTETRNSESRIKIRRGKVWIVNEGGGNYKEVVSLSPEMRRFASTIKNARGLDATGKFKTVIKGDKLMTDKLVGIKMGDL